MKKIFAMIAVLLFSASLRAESDRYLYWMFDSDVEFKYAYIYAVPNSSDGEDWQLLTGATQIEGVEIDSFTPGNVGYQYYSNISHLDPQIAIDDLGFLVEVYIEIGDGIEKLVGASDWVSYTDMVNAKHIYEDISTGGTTPYAFHASAVIPEPTSGLLVLLGMGALALRRKRAA